VTKPSGLYRRQVLRNTVASGIANGWTIVLSLVSVPLLLKGLGSDAFGLWAIVFTFSAVSGWFSLADLGLGIATVRAAADRAALDDRDGLGRVMGTSLLMYLGLASVCGLAFAIAAPLVLPGAFATPTDQVAGLEIAARAFGAQIFVDLLSLGIMAGLEGVQRLDLARAADSGRRTLVVVATVVVALAGGGLAGVAVASLAASVVGAVAMMIAFQVRSRVQLRAGRQEARDLLAYGGQVALLRGTGVLHRTMDRLVVGAILGPGAVTLVEIATQIQNGVAALLSATTQVVTASASWLRARADTETLRELLIRGTKYSTLVTVTVAAIVMVLADPFLALWVGSAYADAVLLVVLALVYLITQAPIQVGSNLLQGTGHVRAILGPAAAGVAVNLTTSIVLVRAIGTPGAFIGTLLGGTVLSPILLRNVLHQAQLPLPTFWRLSVWPAVPVALAAAAGAGAVRLLPLGNLATVLLGTLAGLGGGGFVAYRWATPPHELAELRDATLRKRPAETEPPATTG
jgi:O-antigen/teichoic acid export membrane protein